MQQMMPRTAETSRPSQVMAMMDLKGSPKLGQYLKSLRVGYGTLCARSKRKRGFMGVKSIILSSAVMRREFATPPSTNCAPSPGSSTSRSRLSPDVVDLEELEKNQPAGTDPEQLIREGQEEFRLGDYGRAYVYFQKARTILEEKDDIPSTESARAIAKARLAAAITLYRMGKVSFRV